MAVCEESPDIPRDVPLTYYKSRAVKLDRQVLLKQSEIPICGQNGERMQL